MTPAERAVKLNELISQSAQRLPALTAKETAKAMEIIEQSRGQLVDQLLNNSGADGIIKRERADSLLRSLGGVQNQLNAGMVDSVRTAYEQAVERAGGDMEKAFKEAGVSSLGLDFGMVSSDTLAYLARRFSGEEGGLVLSDRIWKMTADQRKSLEGVITSGILQGKSVKSLSREVRDSFNTSKYNAERLMRTEVNTAYRVAFAKSAESAYVTEEYLQIIRGDADMPNHKCTIMSEEDPYGKGAGVFKASDSEIYNPHPNCTSYLLYVIDEDKVAKADEIEERLDDPEDGEETEQLRSNIDEVMNAKTPKQVEKVLRREMPEVKNINLKGFDLEYSQETAQRLLTLKNRYPEGTQYINHFETIQEHYERLYQHRIRETTIFNLQRKGLENTAENYKRMEAEVRRARVVKKKKARPNVSGFTYQTDSDLHRGIYINKDEAKDYSNAINKAQYSKVSGWHPTNTPVQTVVHEYGHVLDFHLLEVAPEERHALVGELYLKTKDKAYASGDPSKFMGQQLSQYGFTNDKEFVAEAFTEYYEKGDEARDIAKYIGEGMTNLLKKYRG
jgi:hypothetical protein